MVPLVWSDQFNTGVGFIDESHQRIFQLINDLERPDRAEEETTPEEALALFLDYAGRHFEEEEGLMRYLEYPEFEAHRADHDRAVAWVQTLKAQFDAGILEPGGIASFAGDWLQQHIKFHDFPFIQWTRDPKSVEAMAALVERRNGLG